MPSLIQRNVIAIIGTAITMLSPAATQAKEIQSLDEMRAVVRGKMPEFLKDPSEIVSQLLNTPLAPPLSQTFKQARAIESVFGNGAATIATDCRRRATSVGEPDADDCTASNGREGGKGAYTQLSFSKNMGNGNIKFLKRLPVDDKMEPGKLPTAKLSNGDAMTLAVKFLDSAFGLAMNEIPLPPSSSKTSLVRSLVVAGSDSRGSAVAPVVIQKLLTLQRGFKLEKAYVDSTTGMVLTHVKGPGKAMVAVDDTGVVGAVIEGWQELRKDPKMTAGAAKLADELINEIAEDLFNNGVREFENMRFEVRVDADWRGSYGVLLPAVQVEVTPVPHDLTESQQASLAFRSTAGEIRSYSLVELPTEQTTR